MGNETFVQIAQAGSEGVFANRKGVLLFGDSLVNIWALPVMIYCHLGLIL